jgi:hypothetical protein
VYLNRYQANTFLTLLVTPSTKSYRLNTSSNLVDCRIGGSTDLTPFGTWPTALLLTV